MGRSVRPWLLALAGSLLLHAGLFGGFASHLPQVQMPPEPPSIDAQLTRAPARPAPPVAAKPAPRPVAKRVLPPPPAPLPEPPVEVGAAPETRVAEAVAVAAEAGAPVEAPPVIAAETEAAPVVAVPAEAEPAPAAPEPEPVVAALNPMPARLDLRYGVRYGMASGEQTLVWINSGDSYTLTSVAAATGLVGVFYQGRFVQTSRGRITSHGLQPEEFWDQRGDKRSSARFDAAQRQLTLTPAKGAPRHFAYADDVQDALSLLFQLALTAPPPEGPLAYTVFNGKKLRAYTYAVRGEVALDTALGPLRTLHLQRIDNDEGRFEVWLAIDHHYLPVRLRRVEDNGVDGELSIRSISVAE